MYDSLPYYMIYKIKNRKEEEEELKLLYREENHTKNLSSSLFWKPGVFIGKGGCPKAISPSFNDNKSYVVMLLTLWFNKF